MAERLTEKNKISCFEYDLANFEHKVKEFNDYDAFYAYNMAVRKLGKLEDILEKYGIASVEELDVLLEGMKKIWQDTCDAKNDRDTWKRACELACKWFKQTGFIGDQTKVDYFYQQAKKEKEDE